MIITDKPFRMLLIAGLFQTIFLFLLAEPCQAQFHSPAIKKDTLFKHAVSFGPSLGSVMERDAWFWGLAAAYAYQFNGPWAVSSSITYDKETERKMTGNSVINTFTVLGTVSYFISPKFSFTTGLAKGFYDDDNPEKRLKINNGDWSTGLALGYNLPDFSFWEHDSFGLSLSYEYNISQNEFSISLDLLIGLIF